MTVELSLVAKDLAGQTGRSAPIEMVLPERRFTKPLARAVVEQRRRLAEDPRDRLQVARAHRRADAGARGVHRGPAGVPGPALGLLAAAARRHARGAQQRDRAAVEHRAAHRGRQPDRRRARAARRPGAAVEGAGAGRLRRGDPEAHAGAAAGAGAVPRAALQAGAEPAADAGPGPQQPVHDARRTSSRCCATSRTWRARATATWPSRC